MSVKFGISAIVKNALSNPPKDKKTSNSSNSFIVRVIDINLYPNENYTQIGEIIGEIIDKKGISYGKILSNIKPKSSTTKKFPLINEFVIVEEILRPNSTKTQFVYGETISLYGATSVNVNPSPSPLLNPTPLTQTVNYSQVNKGAFNIVDNIPIEIDFNSPNFLYKTTYKEKGNIHPLRPFEGDIIYEGRWGQSIRFGSTTNTKNNFKNNWSDFGENGNPITIIRNGQPLDASDEGWIPITENIKHDLSSIYLTSTQNLPFSLANENFNSYLKEKSPISPSQYNSPQIILNSDRVTLNAKKDNILISGEKSVGISSNSSINIESKQIYLDGTDIKLGSPLAKEPVLKGDTTATYLKMILNELICLSEALKTIKDPTGSPNPVTLTAGSAALLIFEKIYTNIDSIKSNFVKTI